MEGLKELAGYSEGWAGQTQTLRSMWFPLGVQSKGREHRKECLELSLHCLDGS